jgi:hypothetical protein
MFEAELFGVTASEFLTSAQALATPMLGWAHRLIATTDYD